MGRGTEQSELFSVWIAPPPPPLVQQLKFSILVVEQEGLRCWSLELRVKEIVSTCKKVLLEATKTTHALQYFSTGRLTFTSNCCGPCHWLIAQFTIHMQYHGEEIDFNSSSMQMTPCPPHERALNLPCPSHLIIHISL